MSKYREKPVVITAIQWTDELSGDRIYQWVKKSGVEVEFHPHLMDGGLVAHPDPFINIHTLEGVTTAKRGDWVIRGVQGEFYPCKPDIFAATYEPVTDTEASDE